MARLVTWQPPRRTAKSKKEGDPDFAVLLQPPLSLDIAVRLPIAGVLLTSLKGGIISELGFRNRFPAFGFP